MVQSNHQESYGHLASLTRKDVSHATNRTVESSKVGGVAAAFLMSAALVMLAPGTVSAAGLPASKSKSATPDYVLCSIQVAHTLETWSTSVTDGTMTVDLQVMYDSVQPTTICGYRAYVTTDSTLNGATLTASVLNYSPSGTKAPTCDGVSATSKSVTTANGNGASVATGDIGEQHPYLQAEGSFHGVSGCTNAY